VIRCNAWWNFDRYGETITKADIWGVGGMDMAAQRRSLIKAAAAAAAEVASTEIDTEVDSMTQVIGKRRSRADDKRKGSTHCWNQEFLDHIRNRKTGDFLADRRVELIQALRKYYEKKRAQEEKDAKDPIPATFQYGTQKLQVKYDMSLEAP